METNEWKTWFVAAFARLTIFGLAVVGRLPGAPYPRFVTLHLRARRALDRGDHQGTTVLAHELLALAEHYPNDWNYGNAIHHGHFLLGCVALADGDVAGARKELLLAGNTPGSPQLNSFGPDMKLARDLLRVGERGAVLEYLALCRRFWSLGASDLEEWTADIGEGREPNFGPNLA